MTGRLVPCKDPYECEKPIECQKMAAGYQRYKKCAHGEPSFTGCWYRPAEYMGGLREAQLQGKTVKRGGNGVSSAP